MRTAASFLVALGLLAVACSSPSEPTPPPPASPLISCPLEVKGNSLDGKQLVMSYTLPTVTGGAAPVTVTCAPASGSSFPVGITTVACTARDTLSRQSTCSFSVQITAPPRLTTALLMSFGDSLTEGKPSSLGEFPGSYRIQLELLLRARYTAQSPTILPAGLAGETAVSGVLRLTSELTKNPGAVLLMEGANDIQIGADAVEPAVAAMRQMVGMVQATRATAFLATLPPQIPGASKAGGAARVEGYNSRLRQVAAETGAVLVDVWAAFGGKATTDLVGGDGLHLTEAGYKKVADTFFAAIQTRLEEKAP